MTVAGDLIKIAARRGTIVVMIIVVVSVEVGIHMDFIIAGSDLAKEALAEMMTKHHEARARTNN